MKKILPLIFLVNFFAFGQQEISFSNQKDELVKVVPYADGSFSVYTSGDGDYGVSKVTSRKVTSRLYDPSGELVNESEVNGKIGVNCRIHGYNGQDFPKQTVYHPELKLMIMFGGVGAVPNNMTCRILNEKGEVTDIRLNEFRVAKHLLVAAEIHENNLLVVYSSFHYLKKNETWLAVIDLNTGILTEKEVIHTSDKIGTYIGSRNGNMCFLANGKNGGIVVNSIDQDAKAEEISLDFPTEILARQRAGKVSAVGETISPVKYYGKSGDDIYFILYGRESFICKLSSENEVVYQPVSIPEDLKAVQFLGDRLTDFREAVLVDMEDGAELLVSNTVKGDQWEPCSLGRWEISWNNSETASPLEIRDKIMFGTPLDMVAHSGRNPDYQKASDSGTTTGVSLWRTVYDPEGGFRFIEFSNPAGKIPLKAILYKP